MIPMTIGATANVSPARRNQIVDQAVLVAAGLILFMGAVGRIILDYLGITLPAFTIAGGVLLFLIAIDMLFARPTGAKRTEAEEKEAAQGENPAVFPLAVPMIAGPGTIATVLLLVNLSRRRPARSARRRGRIRRGAPRHVALHARLDVSAARHRHDGHSRREPAARHHPRRTRRAVRAQRIDADAAATALSLRRCRRPTDCRPTSRSAADARRRAACIRAAGTGTASDAAAA